MESNPSYNYSFTDIDRYLSGGMSASEMHDIERAALQDPFLADAIEGYQEKNRQQSLQHLNEITAALQTQKAEPAIIIMPKKQSYAWLIAASSIAIIGISIFLFRQSSDEKIAAPLAQNKTSSEERKDTISENQNKPPAPLSGDLKATESQASSSSKKITDNKPYKADKKETHSYDEATTLQAAPAETATTLSPSDGYFSNKAKDDKSITTSEAPMAFADSQIQKPQAVSAFAKRAKVASGNGWTTDKGKPFILSEVPEFNLGRTGKKPTDTSTTKPEGGWQSFQEYLFSKLSKKDTANFNNAARFDGNLELEFSVDRNGLPYDVKVLQAQDSTTASRAAAAVQQGPKWISNSKKEKRLNIRY